MEHLPGIQKEPGSLHSSVEMTSESIHFLKLPGHLPASNPSTVSLSSLRIKTTQVSPLTPHTFSLTLLAPEKGTSDHHQTATPGLSPLNSSTPQKHCVSLTGPHTELWDSLTLLSATKHPMHLQMPQAIILVQTPSPFLDSGLPCLPKTLLPIQQSQDLGFCCYFLESVSHSIAQAGLKLCSNPSTSASECWD